MKKNFILLILSLIGLVGCLDYQVYLTEDQLTEKQWKKIAQENSELTANEILPQAQITPLSKDKIWIDFNHKELCGIRHCLYAIYQINPDTESANLQWRSYLDPKLPPDVSLMEKSNDNCIILHQAQEEQVEKYELCPKNGQYQITRKVPNRG